MEWQLIETAPKDGTSILAYTDDGYRFPLLCSCVFHDGFWWPDCFESIDEPLHPTYWMPVLPFPQ